MISLYQLKPAFQNLLRPGVKRLYEWGITANMVTLTAMLVSVLLSMWLYHYYSNHFISYGLLIFPLWMLIRMAFNAIDGMLAREFGQQSTLGAYYNELCDVVSDTALYLSLSCFSFIHSGLLGLVAFFAILTEYTGVMAPLIGQQRRYDGPMGKSDRAFWFSALVVFICVYPFFSYDLRLLANICNIVFLIMTGLLCFTIYNRIHLALKAAE